MTKKIICTILAIMMIISAGAVSANAANVGKTKAQSIALKDASVKKKNAIFLKTKLETDDGVKQYEVEFIAGKYFYDYEIKSKNGKILDSEVKKLKNSAKKYITKAKAKEIALKVKGFKKSQVTFTECKLEVENRYVVYEVEFFKGRKEYDYDINAKTGEVIPN